MTKTSYSAPADPTHDDTPQDATQHDPKDGDPTTQKKETTAPKESCRYGHLWEDKAP